MSTAQTQTLEEKVNALCLLIENHSALNYRDMRIRLKALLREVFDEIERRAGAPEGGGNWQHSLNEIRQELGL